MPASAEAGAYVSRLAILIFSRKCLLQCGSSRGRSELEAWSANYILTDGEGDFKRETWYKILISLVYLRLRLNYIT